MILWFVAPAAAHRPGLSYGRLSGDSLEITVAAPEIAGAVHLGEDLEASRVLISELLLDGTTLAVSGAPCPLGEASLARVEGDGVMLSVPVACPPGPVVYTAGFLARMEPGHRHYVEAAGEPVAVLDRGAVSVTTTGRQNAGEVALHFGKLGVEHIWTGYDHLVFLFALLIVARSMRAMLLIVTGFTVAHSITLSAAALGWLRLPSDLVELAIAVSIVLVGLENFWQPTLKRRMAVTFGLGLVHGFGFASMLAELGLPPGHLVTALLCFNGGVELGQGLIALVLLPLLLRLRAWPPWEKRVVPALSALVVGLGLMWVVQRL